MLRGKAIAFKRALATASVISFMLIAIVLTVISGITCKVDLPENSVSAYEIINSESGRTVRIAVNYDVNINTSQQLCNYFNTGEKEAIYSGTEEATAQIIDGVVTLRADTTIIFYRGEDTGTKMLNAVSVNYSKLNSNIILDGNNSVIRCENLGVDEAGFYGVVADNIRLFNFINNDDNNNNNNNNYFVTLKNLTLRGGIINNYDSSGAGIYIDANRLDLENVTIRDSKSLFGGGLSINSGVVYAKNCFFIRNIAEYGGGFFVSGNGKLYMENSVCSENRSTRENGGGGAGEVKGELYVNNCTFSGNISTEYGGALNVFNGHVYAFNSTFTGNVTTNSGLEYGGAIGIHGGSVTLINSLLMHNYAYDSQEEKLGISDIGGGYGNVTMYGCVYSGLGGLKTTDKQEGKCQIEIGNDNVFTSYSSNQIYKADGTLFSAEWVTRPLLLNNGITSVVPLNETANAANNGEIAVKTSVNQDFSHAAYFDPTTEQWTAVVGEFSESYTVEEAEKDFVRIYQDGTERDLKVVGAYGAEGGPYYSVQAIETNGITVKGASYYGETYDASKDKYPKGRDVTVEAIGTNIDAWQISANNGESETIVKGTTGTVYTNVSISADGLTLTIDDIDANYVVQPNLDILYTVKFVYDKITDIPDQVFYTNNRLAIEPKDLTSYTFEGWYTDENFTHKYDFNTIVTKSITLYGKDKPITITLNRDKPANASGSVTLTHNTVYGQYNNSTLYMDNELTTVVSPTAVLKGWFFEGFFTDNDIKVIDSEGKLVSNVNSYTNDKGELITDYGFNLYSKFTTVTRKLTLDAGEGQIAVAEAYAPYDGTILFTDEAMRTEIIPADIIPSDSTLIFTGYFTASTGGKIIINNEGKLVTKLQLDEDATLYAQYADDKEAGYTVEYYHQNLDNDEYTYVFSETHRGSGLVTVQPEVTRGENDEYLYNKEKSVNSGTIKEDGSLTLKIYYDLKIIELEYGYSFSEFLSFEGAERLNYYTLIQRVKYGSAISPPTIVAQDYIYFYGYSNNYDSIELPNTAIKDARFVPVYCRIYSIEYILNKGTNDPDNPTKYFSKGSTTVKNPTKTGCNFVGWEVNGSEPIKDLIIDSGSYYDDITLEAVWEYIQYTVTVNITEGENLGEVIITPSNDYFIYQEKVKVVISPNAGYTVILDEATVDIAEDGTFIMPADNVVIEARILPIVEYYVEYYHQNLDNDEYTCVFSETHRGSGLVTVQPEVTRGEKGEYLYNEKKSVISGTIKEDGSLTLKIYYDLKIIELKYKYSQDYFLSFEGAERFDDYTLIQRVKYGSAIVQPKLVAQDYIYFYGYSDSYSSISMPEKALKNTNFILAYSWMYSIEYILNDGINALDNPTKYIVNEGATVKNPTKTGCNFVGWKVNGSEPIKDLTLKSEIYSSDIELEAVWEILYTVNVNITEGENLGEVIITPSKDYFIYQEKVKVVISPKAGYTVILDGATVDIAEDGTFIMPADNVVIEARILPIVEYYVEYYHQNLDNDEYTYVGTETYSGAGLVTVQPEVTRGENDEYLYNEKKSVISGTIKEDGSLTLKIYYDLKIIELKYEYSQDYFLSFEGAERLDDNTLIQRVKYGSDIIQPKLVAQDYIYFYGYSNNYDSIELPNTAIKDARFVAVYCWIYSIKYILNNGINDSDNPTKYIVNEGATVKNPTKTGCNFVGWKVNGSEPIKDLIIDSGSYYNDITLEAVWEYIQYTVTVNIIEGGNYGEVIITPSKDYFIYQENVKVVISPNAGYTVILDGATVDIAEDGTFIMPADNVVIGVRIIPIEVEYKVIVYKQNIEGDGYVSEENTYSEFTGTVVNVDIPEHKGFKLNEEKSTVSGAVAGDGSTIYEIYLDRLTYSIVWRNDVQVLQIQYYRYGAKPVYDGAKPEKAETDVCSYEFIGWDREILPVNANEIYFAKFNRIVKAVDTKPSVENEVEAEITFEKQVVAEENDVITLVVSVLPEEKITVPQYLEIIESYEAKLLINGVDISDTPEGEMKITISAPKELTGRKNVTIVMADANGNTVSKKAVIEGGYITFTTDVLGDFVIAADWEMPNSFFILLGLLLLIILAIIIFIVSQIFNNRKI